MQKFEYPEVEVTRLNTEEITNQGNSTGEDVGEL